MKKGIIKFSGYNIESMNYSRKKIYIKSDEYIDLTPQFLFKLAINDTNPQYYNLLMGVRVGYNNEKYPLKVELILRGFFELDSIDMDKATLHNLYIINSSAILFPYLRSTLTDITSKSDHSPIILPTFNFHTSLEDMDYEDLIIDPSNYKSYS